MECAIDNEFFAGNFPAKLSMSNINILKRSEFTTQIVRVFSHDLNDQGYSYLRMFDCIIKSMVRSMRLSIFEIQRAGQQISRSDQLAQKTFERTL